MHILSITGLACKVIFLAAIVYWVHIFFSTIHLCSTLAGAVSGSSLPFCSTVGFIVTYNTLTRLLVAFILPFYCLAYFYLHPVVSKEVFIKQCLSAMHISLLLIIH